MLVNYFALILTASIVMPSDARAPVSPYGETETTQPIVLKFDTLAEPERFGLNGRFVLSNQSHHRITLSGQTHDNGLLKISSSFNPVLFVVFRFAESSSWEQLGGMIPQGDIPSVEVNLEPGESMPLEVLLPRSPAYFAQPWLLQLYLEVGGQHVYVNSEPFYINKEK